MGLLGACSAATPAESIAPPSAGADPRLVLGVYLEALKAGDCKAARRLAARTFIPGNGELCGQLKVTSYKDPGEPALAGNGEAIFSTTLTVTGADDSIRDGDNVWFYTLMKQTDGQWRLTGGGSGP